MEWADILLALGMTAVGVAWIVGAPIAVSWLLARLERRIR